MARVTPHRPASGAVIAAATVVIFFAVLFLSVPYYAITPGPAENVLDLIDIEGTKTKPVTGKLMLTTVSLRDVRVFDAIRGWFDETYEILPRSTIVKPGESEADAQRLATEQMRESQMHAAASALDLLGYDVKTSDLGVRVRDLVQDAPASAVLRRGDIIVGADAAPVRRFEDVVAAIRRHRVGEDIVLKVMRAGSELTVRTKTVGRPENPGEPVIGAILETVRGVERLPIAIDINSLGIGGPSAGLMYALGIVDLLDSTDLTRGRTIAGTGEIDVGGRVDPVGGVSQKIGSARRVGADLFVVPVAELAAACARADDLPVIGVEDLRGAVQALRSTKPPPGRSCT